MLHLTRPAHLQLLFKRPGGSTTAGAAAEVVEGPPRHINSKGTAVKKSSQIKSVGATALPERVSAAMSEIVENM